MDSEIRHQRLPHVVIRSSTTSLRSPVYRRVRTPAILLA
jgi:hypothetical protein